MEAPLQMASTDGNNDELVKVEETQSNKRRRKKSIVWEHFTVESVGDGCTRAVCKQCKQTFSYSNGTKVAGTSHLKRHIALGVCPVIRRREKNQLAQYNTSPSTAGTPGISTDPPQRRYRGTPFIANFPFDQDRSRQQIAEMIIMHDYPLHMVEHSAFVSFVQNLQPHFNIGNFDTIEADCIEIYSREKQHLAKLLTEIPGQISLALDLWISSQSVGYVFLMGYFIDNFWKLHRHVLNVVLVPSPYSEDALGHAIGVCLHDWGLDKKLCTITLDRGIWNDSETEFLRGFLSINKNPKILDGQFLIEHCYAHVLRSIAVDGLEAMCDLINKVRESIKYVKTSQANEERFFELKQQLQVPSMKSLFLDDQTQWNTTYQMLLAAMELKEVFSCLDTADPDYKLAPTMDDWKQIETLCSYLKLLYDAASLLLDISTTTANLYFHEVWKIQLEFTLAAMSEDQFVRSLTNPLKEKFDGYWKDCNLVLAITVVVDPRFKMKLVEFSFSKIYGDDASMYIKTVDDCIRELFSEYSAQQPLMITSSYVEVENNAEDAAKTDLPQISGTVASDRLVDFDVFISTMAITQPMKSELDQYLEEAVLARVQDFDILSWWKLNQIKFPTLSRMARDLLSIPVSTVSPDIVFKTESNKLDQYRSSLRPETLEALVCVKDWHQSLLSTSSCEVSTSNAIVKMEY